VRCLANKAPSKRASGFITAKGWGSLDPVQTDSRKAAKRKILVFAHVPPPVHGQSVMVQSMLDGLRNDKRLELHHVDARFSRTLSDVGSFRVLKLWSLFGCVLHAWRLRLRHGPMVFYYVPAPAKTSAILRDCVVMAMCRPVFPVLVLHWHAHGLVDWVKEKKSLLRSLARRLLAYADLSIVLGSFQVASVAELRPCSVKIVANGIDDPCKDFETSVLPKRNSRLHLRRTGGRQTLRLLFLGNCTQDKGIFRVMDAMARLLAAEESSGRTAHCRLEVAGAFVTTAERDRFESLSRQKVFRAEDGSALVNYHGFLSGEDKLQLLRDSDVLVFPTLYPTEVQPVVLIEAMAHGLPVVATRWRGIPDMFPREYPLLCEPGVSDSLLCCLQHARDCPDFSGLRELFLGRFTAAVYHRAMADALADA